MTLKSTYNRIAEDWIKDHEHDQWWIPGTDKFISFLTPGQSVLDVGCAGGLKAEYLAKKGFVVTGIDLSENMINAARQRLPHGSFFVRDIHERLDMQGTFDGIFVQAVLLHIPKKNVVRVLKNLTNLLNKNGYLYIAVKQLREGAPEEEIVKENDYGYEYERFFSFYTLAELREYLDALGLHLVWSDVSSTGDTKWIQLIAQQD